MSFARYVGVFVTAFWAVGCGGEIHTDVDESIDMHRAAIGKSMPENAIQATKQVKIVAADGALGDLFGYRVAASGDTVLIGVPNDDDKGAESGSAYVYVRNGDAWSQEAKLVAADGVVTGAFGSAVALAGDTAIIGAPRNAGKVANAGAAYVFVRSGGTWTQQTKLVASDGQIAAMFGHAVAISGDTVIVSAVNEGDLQIGAAYAFVRSGGTWTEQAKFLPNDGVFQDKFGDAVALFGDTALVGASMHDANNLVNTGAAYVFTRNGSAWAQQAKLASSDIASNDAFGISVALEQDTALIGARADDGTGSAHVFTRNGGNWAQQAKLAAADGLAGDNFGHSVALGGGIAIVSAFLGDGAVKDSGAAYVFASSAGTWAPQTKIMASDGAMTDAFGFSVALSANTVVLGAHLDDDKADSSGAAYTYLLAKTNGDACSAAGECLSGFCADGVCCDVACGGGASDDCQACSLAAGAASNGTCAPLAAGVECQAASSECTLPATCDGASTACPANPAQPDGTACTGGTCMAGQCAGMGAGGNGGSGSSSSGSGGGSGGDGGGTGGQSEGGAGGAGNGDGGSSEDGSCGCRVVGNRESHGWAVLVLSGLLAWRKSRRARLSAKKH